MTTHARLRSEQLLSFYDTKRCNSTRGDVHD
jgi:hypothetical protein